MALMTGAELAVEVKKRYGGETSQRLIQMTNQDNTSSTTIDDTVLNSAGEDAIGDFLTQTGVNPDIDNFTHVAKLISGVIYYLEFYKGRDSQLLKMHEKKFYAGLGGINKKKMIRPQSNSTLEQSKERTGARPDFDRSKNVWRYGRHTAQTTEGLEISGDC